METNSAQLPPINVFTYSACNIHHKPITERDHQATHKSNGKIPPDEVTRNKMYQTELE